MTIANTIRVCLGMVLSGVTMFAMLWSLRQMPDAERCSWLYLAIGASGMNHILNYLKELRR